jgi:proteasome lid subunit RPN8/RPN11
MDDSQTRSVRLTAKVKSASGESTVARKTDAELGHYGKTIHRFSEENRRNGDCDVWILQSVFRQVVDHLAHDTSREHGGLLLGYEIESAEGKPAVVVAHSLPANHTHGSPVRLEIKEDSWAEWDRISDRYVRGYGWRRVGWYHSHPGIRIFLSKWDLDVCRDWERPTHVAMVVDPVGNQGGFFVRGKEGFRSESPQSFLEIHNVSSESIVVWGNHTPQPVAPENQPARKHDAAPEPAQAIEELAGTTEPGAAGPVPASKESPQPDTSEKPAEPVNGPPPQGRRPDRVWMNVTVVALLLILLAANSVLIAFVARLPRETVNLQPLSDQIGQLRADIANIRPAAAAAPKGATPAPSSSQPPAETAPPPKQAASAPASVPLAIKLAIAKKPTVLKPTESFQFKVNGNPAPDVVWSLEGPGSIDPHYGLYRAPDQFSGEAKVKVTAISRTESQSVTFTLRGTSASKGTSGDSGKKSAQATDTKQPDDSKQAADKQPPDNADKQQQP